MSSHFIAIVKEDKQSALKSLVAHQLSKPALTSICANMMAGCNIIAHLVSRTCLPPQVRHSILNIANAIAEGYLGGNDMMVATDIEHLIAHLDDISRCALDGKPDDSIILDNDDVTNFKILSTDSGDSVLICNDGTIYVNGRLAK